MWCNSTDMLLMDIKHYTKKRISVLLYDPKMDSFILHKKK